MKMISSAIRLVIFSAPASCKAASANGMPMAYTTKLEAAAQKPTHGWKVGQIEK